MHTNVRLLLLAALATLAVFAGSAAPASASEFLIEGEQVTAATNAEGTSTRSLLKTEILGIKAEIECSEDTFTGKIEAAGRGLATLLLKKCKETSPAKCSVAETLQTKLKDKLIGTGTEAEFEPTTPEGNFFEVTITGAECTIKGTYKVTGTQACELPKAEEELVEHEISCPTTKSKLKVLFANATFSTTEKVKLASGKKWGAISLQPPPPEKVDFRGNQPVLVDHRNNTAHGGSESAIAINEYGKKNEVEWERSKAGELEKIWPVVYVLGTKVELEARFTVSAATRERLEKNAEEVELIGETVVASGAMSFSDSLDSEEIKAQLKEHAEYISMKEVIKSSSALVKKVANSLATITWKWHLQEKGRPHPIIQELGKSTNTFYLLYQTPVAGTKIFFTLLDLDTLQIAGESEPLTEAKAISGAWSGFSSKQKVLACLTLECPTLRIRTYNPANGEITRANNAMWYYEQVPTGLTLQEYRQMGLPACLGRSTTVLLLATLSGECGGWARMFKNALGTEGIESTRLLIYAQFPAGDLVCEVAQSCRMMVSTWTFAGGEGTSGEPAFPYTWSEVTDGNGVPGQGVENPRSFFNNHQIIEVGNKLYDPSYGAGPIGKGNPGERVTNLALLQEESISGFCRPVGATFNCKPAEAGKPKLGSTALPGVESEEETEEELIEP